MPSLVTERIESVKAGVVGASVFAIAELVIALLDKMAVITIIESTQNSIFLSWELPLQLAIGALSGFLFGVTYRYIIRDDRNSHLNDGAVLAFGLVRGLALIEKNLVLSELLSAVFLILQSIICFAIVRFVLDLAIDRKLIKPFV